MTFDVGLIFFISMLLMWIKPGPTQLLKVATTLDKGLVFGICFSLGSILMCCVFFVIAALGYKALSDVFNYTGFFLQIFGAVYLIFISIKGFKKLYFNQKTTPANHANNVEVKGRTMLSSFSFGFLATMASPFWIFYFIGILPALIPLSEFTFSGLLFGAFLVLLSGATVDWPFLTLIKQLQTEFLVGKISKFVSLFINFSFLGIAFFLIYSAFFVQESAFDINNVLHID